MGRRFVTHFVLDFLLLAAVSAPAEVIHLKNGRTIWADHIRENGPRVEYDLGDNSYAIPKASVEKIETGGLPPEYASSAATKQDVPVFVPPDKVKNEAEVSGTLVKDGRVDSDALAAIEQQGNPARTAAAYFYAGKYEFEHGNLNKSRTYFDTALRFDGQNPTILNYYASLLVRTGNARDAVSYAQKAVQAAASFGTATPRISMTNSVWGDSSIKPPGK